MTQSLIAQQGKSAQLTSVKGAPSTLREAIVRTIEPDGSVSVEMVTGRSGAMEVKAPGWYHPKLGDRVLMGELNGDAGSPVLIAPR